MLVDSQTIATAVGVTRPAIVLRAKRESWEQVQQGRKRPYVFTALPPEIQSTLRTFDPDRFDNTIPQNTRTQTAYNREALWEMFDAKPAEAKAKAVARHAVLCLADDLYSQGTSRRRALETAAQVKGLPVRGIISLWYGRKGRPGVRTYHRRDWLAACVDQYCGRMAKIEIPAEAWDLFKTLYLDRQRLSLANCHRRVVKAAALHGWGDVPSEKVFERRVKSDISAAVLVLLREGREAADKLFPAMQRDHSSYHAMEAVNGDGVKFKANVRWDEKTVARPCVWFWQDVFSGMILAWRADISENADMLRLAFGDLLEAHGIPQFAYIDNTRAAANKWMTGRTIRRHRWVAKGDDPLGVMPQCGVEVLFTTPYHGQAKPIERAFSDMRESVDRHPVFRHRGTQAKPVPLDEFLTVLAQEIAEHNERKGRRSPVCNGRSFTEVYQESYERHVASIPRPTRSQRNLWLLTAEKRRADKDSGAVALGRGPHGPNLYWSPELVEYAGRHLVVRFDPQHLHNPVHVYTLDGRYICEAECTWRAGFGDTESGRNYARARAQFRKATRKAAEAELRLSHAEAVGLLSNPDPAQTGQAGGRKVVKMALAANDDISDTPTDEEVRELAVGGDVLIMAAHKAWREREE